MKVGRRLAMKVLNASRFVLGLGSAPAGIEQITEPVDLAMLATLRQTIEQATAAFDEFNYTAALEATETFFWTFCDDYVELVKERAYGTRGEQAAASANAALQAALRVLLRLLAPFMPFVTEEVWSWWQPGSVHRANWPAAAELPEGGDAALLQAVSATLIALRQVKSAAKVSPRAEITHARISGPGEQLGLLRQAETDLRAVAHITGEPAWQPTGGAIEVTATLAGQP